MHVVLLGDSIFDNARYVPGGPAVIDQLKRALPAGSRATLLAVDGATTGSVPRQADQVPADATHVVLSVGGNDALAYSVSLLQTRTQTTGEGLAHTGAVRDQFQNSYRRVLDRLRALDRPTAVCTIYDAIPGLGAAERTGLAVFNDTILREAVRAGFPVIDLRLVCNERTDYAASSPIEPSVAGGGKITRAIARMVERHDFAAGTVAVYA